MKKITTSIMLLAALVLGFTSCQNDSGKSGETKTEETHSENDGHNHETENKDEHAHEAGDTTHSENHEGHNH